MPLPVINFEGGLVRDPDYRIGQNGRGWASMRIACNNPVRDANGGWTDGPATFIDVVVFGKYAEYVADSVSQGDQVVGFGRLQQNDYEKDGVKVTSYRILADAIGPSNRFGSAKTERTGGGGGGGKAAPADDPWGAPRAEEPPF